MGINLIGAQNSFIEQSNITYLIKPHMVQENIDLILQVFQRLKRTKLKGVKYSVYLMGENVFIHTVQFADKKASEAFSQLNEVIGFRKNLNERLLGKPITNEVEEIGSFSCTTSHNSMVTSSKNC